MARLDTVFGRFTGPSAQRLPTGCRHGLSPAHLGLIGLLEGDEDAAFGLAQRAHAVVQQPRMRTDLAAVGTRTPQPGMVLSALRGRSVAGVITPLGSKRVRVPGSVDERAWVAPR